MEKYYSIVLLIIIYGCSIVDRRGQMQDVLQVVDTVGRWVPLREGQRIDDYVLKDQKIYCGEIACGVDAMDGVDAGTFQINSGSRYAKDKSNVYYPLQITCVDGEECGVCYCVKFVVEDANPEDFVYLGKDYAKDDASVYFRGWLLDEADVKTFKVLKGAGAFIFAVDRDHVFLRETIFTEADAATFYYDSLHAANIKGEWIHSYVLRDKDHIWKYTPPDTFEKLTEN
jgi:hypothetical protein